MHNKGELKKTIGSNGFFLGLMGPGAIVVASIILLSTLFRGMIERDMGESIILILGSLALLAFGIINTIKLNKCKLNLYENCIEVTTMTDTFYIRINDIVNLQWIRHVYVFVPLSIELRVKQNNGKMTSISSNYYMGFDLRDEMNDYFKSLASDKEI